MIRPHRRPAGITALAFFFMFGATMSGLAAFLLLLPGSPVDVLWQLNPHAREGFALLGLWAVLLMLAVCVACITAAIGLWRCARYGFWTAVVVLSVNLIGDAGNALYGHEWRTLIGLPIGGALLAYLIATRRWFAES